jgi:hypothetical protein
MSENLLDIEPSFSSPVLVQVPAAAKASMFRKVAMLELL